MTRWSLYIGSVGHNAGMLSSLCLPTISLFTEHLTVSFRQGTHCFHLTPHQSHITPVFDLALMRRQEKVFVCFQGIPTDRAKEREETKKSF
jgi:hypothetical protein